MANNIKQISVLEPELCNQEWYNPDDVTDDTKEKEEEQTDYKFKKQHENAHTHLQVWPHCFFCTI